MYIITREQKSTNEVFFFHFGLHLFRRLDGFLGGDVCLTVAYVGIL